MGTGNRCWRSDVELATSKRQATDIGVASVVRWQATLDKLAAKVQGILLAQAEASGDSEGKGISGPQSVASKPAAELRAKAQQVWKDALHPLTSKPTVRWDKAVSSVLESKVLSPHDHPRFPRLSSSASSPARLRLGAEYEGCSPPDVFCCRGRTALRASRRRQAASPRS